MVFFEILLAGVFAFFINHHLQNKLLKSNSKRQVLNHLISVVGECSDISMKHLSQSKYQSQVIVSKHKVNHMFNQLSKPHNIKVCEELILDYMAKIDLNKSKEEILMTDNKLVTSLLKQL